MKKLNYLLMAAAMTLGLASCSQESNPGSPMVDQTTEGKVIIKEINIGSVKNAEGKRYDACHAIVLYNNGGKAVTLSNFGFATAAPLTAITNKNYGEDGKLIYEKEGYVPALQGLWYYPGSVTIEPYTDFVIAVRGAIDHTDKGGFDLSKPDLACYDIDVYTRTEYYPEPTIPQSKWMKAIKYTSANSWAVSISDPSLFLFSAPATVTLAEYLVDESNIVYLNGDTKKSASNKCAKIPMEWVVDGVELFKTTQVAKSIKRLPDAIDAGYGLYLDQKGYSAYRNIDEKATINLGDNMAKLVYNYADGVEGTTDPSGIDAAASAKKGARIIYQDTNNSTADFHLRKGWSLK